MLRAAVNAGHAVDALPAPCRPAADHGYVAYGAALLALAAGYAFAAHRELAAPHEQMSEQRIDRVRLEPRLVPAQDVADAASGEYLCRYLPHSHCRSRDLLAGELVGVEVEHGYVGIGHDYRPGCVEREVLFEPLHAHAGIVAAGADGVAVCPGGYPEALGEAHHGPRRVPRMHGEYQPYAVSEDEPGGVESLLQKIRDVDGPVARALRQTLGHPARVAVAREVEYHTSSSMARRHSSGTGMEHWLSKSK